MKKIIITGFEPFDNEAINPSSEVAMSFAGKLINGYEILYFQLPCVFDKSIAALDIIIKQYQPDMVLCLGQMAGRVDISLERIAVNLNDARIPDNEGNQPIDTPVLADAPAAYFSNFPLKIILERLRAQSIPCSISQSAGTFVCNHVFFGLMHLIHNSDRKIMGGFIHLPYLPEQVINKPGQPSMGIELMKTAIATTLSVIAS